MLAKTALLRAFERGNQAWAQEKFNSKLRGFIGKTNSKLLEIGSKLRELTGKTNSKLLELVWSSTQKWRTTNRI
jgi:hypothetical protein